MKEVFMATGGVNFKKIMELLDASPDNLIANTLAERKEKSDAAVAVMDSGLIIIVKGSEKQRKRRRRAIIRDVGRALDMLL